MKALQFLNISKKAILRIISTKMRDLLIILFVVIYQTIYLSLVCLAGQLAQLVTILSSLASLAPVTSTAGLEELEVGETKFENCCHRL